MLKELGQAINESISSSLDVNDHIQRIRDEGYSLYVVLDATIGLGKDEDEPEETSTTTAIQAVTGQEVQFRINVSDLAMLRAIGIDPTRKVKVSRRIESKDRKPTE